MAIFKKNEQKNKFIAMGIALFILIILFLAGPAAAFTVNWTVPENGYSGEEVSFSVIIEKNTNEVFSDEITAQITATGATYTDVTMRCTQTQSELGGYGYGYLNNSNSGYGYGHGYGYGNGLTNPKGQIECDGTFTPSVTGTHTITLLNGGFQIGDPETISITNRPSTGGSSSTTTVVTTTNTTTDDTTDEPGTTTETVYEVTETVTYTPEQLEEVLSNMTDDTTETDTTTEETPVEAPMDMIPIIIILVVLLVIVGVAYYKKDDIQKMLKK